MSSALAPFDFQGRAVRVIVREGSPWFALSDVCRVLGLKNPRQVAARLKKAQRDDVILNDAIGRAQKHTVVSEQGLYSVILTCDKPAARPFFDWVTEKVLPAIHKTGRYEFHAGDLEGIGIEISLLNHDVQRGHSKRLAAHIGNTDQIIDSRTKLCIAVTGKHPKAVREEGRALGFGKRQRESAPQVLRTKNDIRAAVYAGMALMIASGTALSETIPLQGSLTDTLTSLRQTLRAGGVDADGFARLSAAEIDTLMDDHRTKREAIDRQLVLDLFGSGKP